MQVHRCTLFWKIIRAVAALLPGINLHEPESAFNGCRYFQGIKFYEPELASDTPQAVESDGMAALLSAVSESIGTESGKQLLGPGMLSILVTFVTFSEPLTQTLTERPALKTAGIAMPPRIIPFPMEPD